mgnify:CR=1 FL=1
MVAKLTVALQDDGPFRLDVQLSCATGEILALVGPSGSGKSRVLRSIAGLYRPKRGEIIYGDEVWYDPAKAVNLTPQQRRVGIVFQNYALFPHLSAIKNVMEALGDRPPSERRARWLICARLCWFRLPTGSQRPKKPKRFPTGRLGSRKA